MRHSPVIKCVIWDLDGTLLDGTYLESPGSLPAADPVLTAVLAELAGRGILQAIASKNPPAAARYAQQVTGHAFAASRCDWGPKPAAISSIVAELGLAADAVAFVDDDALERAEVAFALPEVMVLDPAEMSQAADWPQFSPPVVTDEARRRGELYLRRRARQEEAKAFGGSRADFLRYCQTQVRIAPASQADAARLHELSVRTHQFNSTGTQLSAAEFTQLIEAPDQVVAAAWLSDRFGDDGLVGCCVLDTSGWRVQPLMMSCRAMGRGVIDALLAWICQTARDGRADSVAVPCVINDRNVPLRIALTGAGFRASEALPDADSARSAAYARPLAGPLPEFPAWVTPSGRSA